MPRSPQSMPELVNAGSLEPLRISAEVMEDLIRRETLFDRTEKYLR